MWRKYQCQLHEQNDVVLVTPTALKTVIHASEGPRKQERHRESKPRIEASYGEQREYKAAIAQRLHYPKSLRLAAEKPKEADRLIRGMRITR